MNELSVKMKKKLNKMFLNFKLSAIKVRVACDALLTIRKNQKPIIFAKIIKQLATQVSTKVIETG